jgi:hypothetical protein
MASGNYVDVIIRTIDEGSEKAMSFGKKVGAAWKELATPLNQTFDLLNKVEAGVGAVFDAFEQGAEMSRAQSQFENLAESIDSTADALLGRLKDATKGMMSDADLIAQAGQIMSLGLAGTEDEVVRLATVVGELGWDMNQTILTLANNSKMRLDALGLSIEDVDAKTQKFIEAGYDMDKAFDMAVLAAGEEKIALLGSAADTAAGKLKMVKTAVENMQNAFIQGAAEGFADSISGDELATGLGDAAENAERLGTAIGELVAGAMPIAVKMAEGLAETLSGIGELVQFDDTLKRAMEAGLITEAGADVVEKMYAGITTAGTGDSIQSKAAAEAIIKQLETAMIEQAKQSEAWEKAQQQMFRGGDNSNYAATAAEEAGAATGEWFTVGFLEGIQTGGNPYTMGIASQQIEANQAAADLAAEQAEAYAQALEEQIAAQMARRAETGDAFSTAFADFMDPETAIDFNQVLYDSADAAGASATALATLKIATGELTEEQAQAILQQAAIIDYAERLGEAISSGAVSPEAAVDALLAFQDRLEGGFEGMALEFDITPKINLLPPDDVQNELDRWFNGGGDGFVAAQDATIMAVDVLPEINIKEADIQDQINNFFNAGGDGFVGEATLMVPMEAQMTEENVLAAIDAATTTIAGIPIEQRQFMVEANPDNAVTAVNTFVAGTLEPLVSTPYTTTIEADVSAALANVEALISTISRVPRKVNTVFTATVDDSVQNAINAVGG